MSKLQTSPLELSSKPSGFSVVNSFELTSMATEMVLLHISDRLAVDFESIEQASQIIVDYHFKKFKDKPARILPVNLADQFRTQLEEFNYLDPSIGEFVTDEEGLGFGNIYWRIVRKESHSDVGPIHADRWFWDLGDTQFPQSHRRVKVWMPLLQDDTDPGLMLHPGSHLSNFNYSYKVDQFGKKKPVFFNEAIQKSMVSAPIKVGEAIIFNDSLLHGGKVTRQHRISLEFTLGKRLK